ncbi:MULTISPECIES: DUF3168 domain-containing protein [unclassified Facklamia]|uniref:tail completion protein gp17 n=1 Tax=Aerococcaceae TaxID=186827 RepID=UPI0013B5E800|nr:MULTISPECIES: DUF3168 domain-containing protein [unclassified Facklamia]MBS4462819.1 hypothetical protein [Aerococcaceae bacterium zg-B36]NEW65268.1 DUF3168 domain-containing protein [Facklamia sp. 252]NEW68752.1 DUF3168 domain-containing protein [Facklamia sp. 253]QQD66140.1 hypothetical protein JDW14_03270 [Aerococcaceae bacterium zg-252]
MKKPFEQQIFDGVIKLLKTLSVEVYPELPIKEVAYPFVAMGEVQITPKATWSTLLGKAFVTIDVWGDRKQRKSVSEVVSDVYSVLNVVSLGGKRLVLSVNTSSHRILSDNSTGSTLWHGIIFLEYNITI